MILNPFKILIKTTNVITAAARNGYTLLFFGFFAIPFLEAWGGPRFTIDSLNCLIGIVWFITPILMLALAIISMSFWRIVLSSIFAVVWAPILLLSFLIWFPMLKGVVSNEDPFNELLDKRHANSYTDVCHYHFNTGAVGSCGDVRTFETHIFPGLKWIEIREQKIY